MGAGGPWGTPPQRTSPHLLMPPSPPSPSPSHPTPEREVRNEMLGELGHHLSSVAKGELEKLLLIPRFDSNIITPGTDFMVTVVSGGRWP